MDADRATCSRPTPAFNVSESGPDQQVYQSGRDHHAPRDQRIGGDASGGTSTSPRSPRGTASPPIWRAHLPHAWARPRVPTRSPSRQEIRTWPTARVLGPYCLARKTRAQMVRAPPRPRASPPRRRTSQAPATDPWPFPDSSEGDHPAPSVSSWSTVTSPETLDADNHPDPCRGTGHGLPRVATIEPRLIHLTNAVRDRSPHRPHPTSSPSLRHTHPAAMRESG